MPVKTHLRSKDMSAKKDLKEEKKEKGKTQQSVKRIINWKSKPETRNIHNLWK